MAVLRLFKTMAFQAVFLCLCTGAFAGPYAPAPGNAGTTAVGMASNLFTAWATGWRDYLPGSSVDAAFQTPELALGKAKGASFDIVCLGRGGSIALTFDPPIRNGEGWDFAVFENSFSDHFLELGFVEVSSDGETFLRFDCASLTQAPVSGFGTIDPTDVDGLAGKYRQGFGTPFDLQDLAVQTEVLSGQVNLGAISHVRIVDIVGDGRDKDTAGRAIYDPYPTYNSAGFDLEAIGVRHQAGQESPVHNPETPGLLSPADGAQASLQPTLETGPFADADPQDGHMLTTWQVSRNDPAFDPENLALNVTSSRRLTSLTLPQFCLDPDTTYYWRARHYDTQATASDWPESFSFVTESDEADLDGDGLPDDQQASHDWDGDGQDDPEVKTVLGVNSQGAQVILGVEAMDNVAAILNVSAVDPRDTWEENRPALLENGMAAFRIQVTDSSQTARIKVHLSPAAPGGASWHKFDPINGWREYAHAQFAPDRSYVILSLMDGSWEYGDADSLEDGFIVDPGGPGRGRTVAVPQDGGAGFDSGGDCFVQALDR